MKKLLLILSLSFFICNSSKSQELTVGKTKHSFIEWNFGIALIADEAFPFPGTSVLWGKTYISENNFVFEYEAGFALPTLVTGKVGIGKKFNNAIVLLGIRPFPFNVFLQSSFSHKNKGHWIASIEFNPLYSSSQDEFITSRAILNFGYRWNLNKNK